MSEELIKEIRATELDADEMIKSAVQKSKEMIKEAHEKGDMIVQEAVNQEYNKSKKMIENAEEEANREAELKAKKNKEECDNIKNNAMLNFDNAVNMVMERIVKSNGNS